MTRRAGVFTTLFLLCAAALGTPRQAPAESVLLSGSDWSIREAGAGSAEWIPARVPGNIQADLEVAHRIGPLWYGAGDPRLAEVAKKDWLYRKQFTVPRAYHDHRLRLVFDGVDFAYEVWLNGKSLGHRAGQFRRFEFDISGLVKFDTNNELIVRIERIPPQLEHCLAASDGALSGVGTADFFVDCYAYTRKVLKGLKSPTNFGWDWGVNIYTLGIWRDVYLEATGPTAIEWTQVQTELEDSGHAIVKARLELDSRASVEARAIFRVRGHGTDKTTQVHLTLREGANVTWAQLEVDRPALWWPSGQGDQPLYELQAQLEDAHTGAVLDSKRVRFGIREIRWAQVDGAPKDFVNPYRLLVNGRPVRMMGSDMAPPDLLFGRDGERTARLLQLAKSAGMNTLRLWGGGVTLPPQFYEQADELGILLSQEFPLANSVPETDPIFLANLGATITDIVKELRNHPSIVEWVGANEMSWPKGPDHPALQVLKAVCARDDNRIFRPTDPIEGSAHSPWVFTPRTYYEHFNQADVMRYGEFGAQTPANLEVFKREIPLASRWPLTDPNDPVLIRKNVLQAAFTSMDWLLKPVIEDYFGPLDNLEQLVPAGQFTGAQGLRYAVDELRRKGTRIGGLTSWSYNEPWPNGAGTYLVDYDGQPLMNYDFMKQALSPLSISLRYASNLYNPETGVHATLWLVSDLPQAAAGLHWSWIARDRRGRIITRNAGTASIAPQEARELGEVTVEPLRETALGPIFVELRLTDTHGRNLAERMDVFGADNVFVWPFDGLLRNSGPDQDDDELLASHPRMYRVLWIQDWDDGRYEDMAWVLRRYGIRSTHVAATREALEKALPTADSVGRGYDAIWLGTPDYRKSETLGERLGSSNLARIAAAVTAGVGLGVEGGWSSYARAGLAGTPLDSVLPATIIESQEIQPRSAMVRAEDSSPLLAGGLKDSLPEVGGYNLIKAKASAHAILRTMDGSDLLVTGAYGKGRVLAYASDVIPGGVQGPVDWDASLRTWTGYPFFVARLLSWISGAPDSAISAIDLPTAASRLVRPVRRTQLRWTAKLVPAEGGEEALEINLLNDGAMTALFCSPHSLRQYRTDTLVLNNHISIPPGESRTITVLAPATPRGSRTLARTGWRVSCWNTDDVDISAGSN